MSVELTNRSGALVPEKQMHSLLDFCITYMELHPDCAISLTFVDVTEMEELYIKWMDEPGPTDVLSFPMDLPEHEGEVVTLGDINEGERYCAIRVEFHIGDTKIKK